MDEIFQSLNLKPMVGASDDLGSAIFIVVFLVVGFVNWLIKVLKEKAAAAERQSHVPTDAELEARRLAWERQTRQGESASPSPAPAPVPQPAGGGTLGDLLGEMRRAYDEASKPKPVAPPPPPPLPMPTHTKHQKPQAQPQSQSHRASQGSRPLAPPVTVPVVLVGASENLGMSLTPPERGLVVMHSRYDKPKAHPLTRMLRTGDGYRQAFVLREVLGPPRALEEYEGL